VFVDTDFLDAQILGAAASRHGSSGLPVGLGRGDKRHEGKGRRKVVLATGKGKPLKAEAQGRHSHETRREGFWAEQSVKRLRKPGGAAQPGEVSPVLVAALFLKRRRAKNPMEGRS
jgi:hypothetical protein